MQLTHIHINVPGNTDTWDLSFGMCKDRFGVQWMVSLPGPA